MWREILTWYARLWPRKMGKPPFTHIIQIGDPTLRAVSKDVSIASIKSQHTSKILDALVKAMRSNNAVGMAAPQIGINERIFVMEVTQRQKMQMKENQFELKEMSLLPLMVFINPEMRVVNFKKVIHDESCESIKGYAAQVPRYHEVSITAYNQKTEKFTVNFKGWLARIAQHELDHLDGKVLTDVMLTETFHCVCWKEVNLYRGKVTIPFS